MARVGLRDREKGSSEGITVITLHGVDRALVVKNLLYPCSLSKNCLNTFTKHTSYCLQVGVYWFLSTYILIFIYIYIIYLGLSITNIYNPIPDSPIPESPIGHQYIINNKYIYIIIIITIIFINITNAIIFVNLLIIFL